MAHFSPLSDQQSRFFINTTQIQSDWLEAQQDMQRFRGGMTWRNKGERSYLVKIVDRAGKQISLGPKSPGTEAVFQSFIAGKARASERYGTLRKTLDEQARLNRTLRVGNMPVPTANILRAMAASGILGSNIAVIGTNAIYAYEAMAGVRMIDSLMETGDIDFLWDSRSRLSVSVWDEEPPKIIDILQSVDSTFQPRRNGYSAVSDTGFVVDLIKAEKKVPWTDDSLSLSEGDLVASPIRALTWLVTSPKVETVAVDERGYPVPIVAPDPRCFAIYKHWLATECRDRDPVKRSRDLAQSRGIAALVQQRLPHMPFNARQMRMFPLAIVKAMEVDSGEDTNVFLPGPGR